MSMRILGVGDYNDFGSLYLRLAAEGHDVRVHIAEPDSRDVLAGMVELTPSWEQELPWIREAGPDGLILFEDAGRGELQDRLRREGYRVVGGSAIGDRLEQDRAYGQEVLRGSGLHTLASHPFTDFDEAMAFIAHHPGRYVLKFNGSFLPSDMNYVGMREDGADVVAALTRHRRTWADDYDEDPEFILMEFVKGIETGLGAFFNGREFVGPINLDWEHKRFFAGDLGELTGEMGTVVTYRGGEKLFDATLARVAPILREAGHVGYVNLNTIINDRGIWPLEFTCRFGYPGFAILSALFEEPCATILQRIGSGSSTPLATYDGFAVGVVLTVPPFPYHHGYEELSKGMPICLPADLTAEERTHLHFGEVAMDGAQLVTAGQVGYIMVVTGRGATIADAQRAAYALAGKVAIPNVRYRNDIGDALRTAGLSELTRLGWI
ncbi:MAG: phosphoribosylglycinamide synthetase [Myxococcales bacterium]|nr:phosphoribosylglycinamide synthetase [Myxococcales bacterium]